MPSGRQTCILRAMTVGNQSDNTDNVIILESLHSLFSLQLIIICLAEKGLISLPVKTEIGIKRQTTKKGS